MVATYRKFHQLSCYLCYNTDSTISTGRVGVMGDYDSIPDFLAWIGLIAGNGNDKTSLVNVFPVYGWCSIDWDQNG